MADRAKGGRSDTPRVTGPARGRERLDEYLVQQGYFESTREALGPILSGLIVVEGAVETKPGTSVRAGVDIHVRGRRLQYASRGGYKLAWALERFAIDLHERIALDAGASAGGFTDCLLQAGCSKVYAVDVGYGQLRGKLAADPRVVAFERVNISDLRREQVADVDFCSVDLSYLSLTRAVPILRDKCGCVEMVCLVKPLYEGVDERSKSDLEAIAPVLARLLAALAERNHPVADLTPSPLIGGRGALEFLMHLKEGPGAPPEPMLDRALAEIARKPPVEEPP